MPDLRPHTAQPSPSYPHTTTVRVALPPAAYNTPFEGSAVSEQLARTSSVNSTSSSVQTQQSSRNRTAFKREAGPSRRPDLTYISTMNQIRLQSQRNQ